MSSNKNRFKPPPEQRETGRGQTATQFKPGQSGNPGGRAKNSRNFLQVAFLKALAEDFEVNGPQAIIDAREADPMGYVKTIAALMPKQVEQTQPLDDLTDAELVAGIALLRARLTGGAGEGGDTPPVPTQVN
jgi:hypothetical protein